MIHNKFFIAILTIALVGGLVSFLTSCEQLGSLPSGTIKEKIEVSPNFDRNRSEFVNRRPDVVRNMGEGHGFWSDPLRRIQHNFFFNNNETKPLSILPEDKQPIPRDFRNSNQTIKFSWLGHSSILLSIGNKIMLIDPIFSSSASPFSGLVKRYQPPVIALEDIPEIDFILISHDHYDHLDMATIKHFRTKDVKYIVPLGVSPHLLQWGVDPNKIIEFDWWDSQKIGGLTFICTPAQHFSGRLGPFKNNKSLWASWVVKSPSNNFYFSGDSGYDTHYKKIGEKYGPFDLVFMDSGQYNIRWKAVHNMPDEVIRGFQDLRGKNLIPIHWAMFTLSLHNWYDPIVESTKLADKLGLSIMTPRIGQFVELGAPNIFEKWWLRLMGGGSAQNR